MPASTMSSRARGVAARPSWTPAQGRRPLSALARGLALTAAVAFACQIAGAEGKPAGVGSGESSGGGNGSPAAEAPVSQGQGDKPETGAGSGDASEARGAAAEGRGEADAPSAASLDERLISSMQGSVLERYSEGILRIVDAAVREGVPAGAFEARIREAVAKSISPNQAVKGLEEDAAKWKWLAARLKGTGWPPASVSASFYLAAATALRNGLGEAAVLETATVAAKGGLSADKAGAALTTAAALLLRFKPASAVSASAVSASLARIAPILVKSKLRVGQFQALADLAARAAAAGVTATRFAEAFESTIGRGGRLAELEKALSL